MDIKFYNTPEAVEMDQTLLQDQPNFIKYKPDFVLMNKLKNQHQDKTNLVVIGHGGSITSFLGIYSALAKFSTKKVFIISTVDPDYIAEVKQQVSPENTLVLAISKSGETVTQIEALLQFLEFPLLILTGVAGPLAEIAHTLNAQMVVHPPIGGRYTGFTEVGLLPAALCGIDVEKIYEGGQEVLQKYSEKNLASDAASIFYQLEQKGIVDVFLPIYSHALFPFSNLVVQLCHESFGKNDKGQTYFAHEAPESQHHTNQRFFGGPKNIAGWFIGVEQPMTSLVSKVPTALTSVPLKDKDLSILNSIPLQDSLRFEREATIEDARINNIPIAEMQLTSVNALELGRFMAFWQLYAIYSSLLRGADPYNQPQVENSKKISFTKREQFKGQL